MTAIGLAHYGGTLGLYNEPRDEQVRALAHYADIDDRRRAAKVRRDREEEIRRAREGG